MAWRRQSHLPVELTWWGAQCFSSANGLHTNTWPHASVAIRIGCRGADQPSKSRADAATHMHDFHGALLGPRIVLICVPPSVRLPSCKLNFSDNGNCATGCARRRRGPSRPAGSMHASVGSACDPLVALCQSVLGIHSWRRLRAPRPRASFHSSRSRAHQPTEFMVLFGAIAAMHREVATEVCPNSLRATTKLGLCRGICATWRAAPTKKLRSRPGLPILHSVTAASPAG